MDPGYKKIIPSQARGLGGAISPPVGAAVGLSLGDDTVAIGVYKAGESHTRAQDGHVNGPHFLKFV